MLDETPRPTAPECATAPVALSGDAALAAGCRRGDPGALERLVARFQAPVFGTALRLVGDRDTALELTNAVLFRLSRSLDRYDPARPLRPWVLRFAANEALNWLRARRREHRRLLGGAAGAVVLAHAAGGPDPEAAALAAERRAAVRAALARLPARPRLLLTLRFFGELSYREIAVQTGQAPNAVGVQLLRARRRLRDELRRSGYPDG
jgi:RNA polymerase sigma-70 factor (ECF subfamily)